MSGTTPGRWVDLAPGHRFPNWTVVAHVAEGSMASVYQARYTGLRQLELPAMAALKITSAALAPDGPERAREYDVARRVAGHPNVVEVHDVFEADTPESGRCVVLVSELADESLHHRIQRAGPLPIGELEAMAVQVAAGMAALHGAGVVHGDLKPANILSFPGAWKLADFGAAAVGCGRGHVSWSGGASFNGGTFWYSTPGRADALLTGVVPPDVDRCADIWAFGVLLHEAATGRRPFANAAALLAGVVDLEGGLPPAVSDVIRTCLGSGPERIVEGSELLDLLSAHGFPVAATPAGVAFRSAGCGPGPPGPARRRRAPAGLGPRAGRRCSRWSVCLVRPPWRWGPAPWSGTVPAPRRRARPRPRGRGNRGPAGWWRHR